MLFNTIEFIIFFIVVLISVEFIKYRKFQHLFLLMCSYFFFYFSSNYLVTLLIFSTLLDFYAGKAIWNSTNIKRKKLILCISLAGNLGLLGFFKYVNFGIEQFNLLGNFIGYDPTPFLNIALPIGISFYTFQTISYTVDIYRGKLKPSTSLTEFAIFVSFFPQLVAGPILRAKDFLPQLREKMKNFNQNSKLRLIVLNSTNLKVGITLMAFGFLKKVFFADNISPLVNNILGNPIGYDSLSIMLGAVGYGIKIYGDFSGYSDIAIGAALILGFKIPMNFNKPYFATSPSDFWKRWHISLSTWLRDYLYIPLGGNKKSNLRTYGNLMTVMLLGGLWHGAAFNFIIWGALHGLYLAVHKLLSDKIPDSKLSFFKTKPGKIIAIIITQYFVFLAWIPFRVQDTNMMLYAMEKYLFFDFQIEQFQNTLSANLFPTILIALFIILNFVSYKKNLVEKISNLNLTTWILFLSIVMMLIFFFFDGNPEDFIYFKF